VFSNLNRIINTFLFDNHHKFLKTMARLSW